MMTQDELDALPENGGDFGQEERIIDGRRVRVPVMKTTLALFQKEDDPLCIRSERDRCYYSVGWAGGVRYKTKVRGLGLETFADVTGYEENNNDSSSYEHVKLVVQLSEYLARTMFTRTDDRILLEECRTALSADSLSSGFLLAKEAAAQECAGTKMNVGSFWDKACDECEFNVRNMTLEEVLKRRGDGDKIKSGEV